MAPERDIESPFVELAALPQYAQWQGITAKYPVLTAACKGPQLLTNATQRSANSILNNQFAAGSVARN
jgi:hypothetical protein